MGHGSRDPDGQAELLQLRNLVACELGRRVALGVLEFATPLLPGLETAFDEVADAEVVAAQPLLLFDGMHDRHDMPAIAARMADRYGVDVRLGAPLGDAPELVDLIEARLVACGAGPDDVLLFVGRGSSELTARERTEALATQVAGRLSMVHEVCYAGISRPDIAEGMARALAHDTRRVLAVPHLLHRGALHRRVGDVLVPIAEAHRRELLVLPHIGNAPSLVALLVRRVHDLVAARHEPAAMRVALR